jgi:hypothetical protein
MNLCLESNLFHTHLNPRHTNPLRATFTTQANLFTPSKLLTHFTGACLLR